MFFKICITNSRGKHIEIARNLDIEFAVARAIGFKIQNKLSAVTVIKMPFDSVVWRNGFFVQH